MGHLPEADWSAALGSEDAAPLRDLLSAMRREERKWARRAQRAESRLAFVQALFDAPERRAEFGS